MAKLDIMLDQEPYNTVVVKGLTYDDYALTIEGQSYEVSVCRDNQKIYINKFGE